MAHEQPVRAHHQRASLEPRQFREDEFEVSLVGGIENVQREPELARCRLEVAGLRRRVGIGRVEEQREDSRCRHQLVQQFEPLWHQLHRQAGDPGEIAARPV